MNLISGDIGGTKTVLSIYSFNDSPKKIFCKYYASVEWESFESILLNFINELPNNMTRPKYGCIGVAGPVFEGKAKITNLNWNLDSKELSLLCKVEKLELVNDFSVLLFGIPFFKKNQYEIIQGDLDNNNNCDNQSFAIIGAGTGLGMARGLIKHKNIFVSPSEGGHREFSPRNEAEWSLVNWLKTKLNLERISIERIVSGTGLGMIGRWKLTEPEALNHPLQQTIKEIDFQKTNSIDFPSLVFQQAQKGDPLMSEALQLWLSAYGSASGDLALQELCSSGLWIAGGTAAKNLSGIRSFTFLNAFRNKGRFKSYLEKIPLIILKDPEATLFSSACRAHLIAESGGRLN